MNTGTLDLTIYSQAVTLEGVISFIFTGAFIANKLISPIIKVFKNILEMALKRPVIVTMEMNLKLSCHIINCLNQLLYSGLIFKEPCSALDNVPLSYFNSVKFFRILCT
jgi:hypothetical protein